VGGVVAVRAGSIAAELGLRPGDALLSINGHILRDVIDYRFYGAEEELELVVERGGERIVYEVERGYDQDLGIEFAEPTFDGLRLCNNRCEFCFFKGMPPGMRRSLYIKDDDYRYSFLFGNYITLTNLTEDDWGRLAEQRLSPLYVSVHATDLALRRCILGNTAAPDVIEQLKWLGSLGIQVHAQIVLIPGLNDGQYVTRTVADLATHYPTVQSIAVVPLGLTKYHRCPLRLYAPEEAKAIIAHISAWQREYRDHQGLNLVYASDEWYLLAGLEVPPAEEYDGFPQLENGVGLTRAGLRDVDRGAVGGHGGEAGGEDRAGDGGCPRHQRLLRADGDRFGAPHGAGRDRGFAGPCPEPSVLGPCTCRPWSFGPRTQGTKGPGQVPEDQGPVEGP